ncbi:WD40 repeat domain-containing protein [Kitasatospora sp. NPDC059648]|uniref:WD40 repeat domain-containing protein n=1 Tax=Kitasatospora sp. NPDC059648 TaxID=3346894 RepID=UPI00369CBC07
MTFSADGRYALASVAEGGVRLWELATGRCLRTLSGHQKGVAALAVTPDTNVVLTADGTGILRQWELDWELRAEEGR